MFQGDPKVLCCRNFKTRQKTPTSFPSHHHLSSPVPLTLSSGSRHLAPWHVEPRIGAHHVVWVFYAKLYVPKRGGTPVAYSMSHGGSILVLTRLPLSMRRRCWCFSPMDAWLALNLMVYGSSSYLVVVIMHFFLPEAKNLLLFDEKVTELGASFKIITKSSSLDIKKLKCLAPTNLQRDTSDLMWLKTIIGVVETFHKSLAFLLFQISKQWAWKVKKFLYFEAYGYGCFHVWFSGFILFCAGYGDEEVI